MAVELGDLPNEVLLEIGQALHRDYDDGKRALLNLSSTCSFFRNLLEPLVFNEIQLHNSRASVRFVNMLTRRHRGRFVRKVNFNGSAHLAETIGLGLPGEDALWERVWPESFGEIFSNLARSFPNINGVSIKWDFDDDGVRDLEQLNIFDYEESEAEMLVAEKHEVFRMLMVAVYTALKENMNKANITSLELIEVPMIPVSAFRTSPSHDHARHCEEFHEFLGTLSNFSLSLRTPEMLSSNLARIALPVEAGAVAFVYELDNYFHKHLRNCQVYRCERPQIASVAGFPLNQPQLLNIPTLMPGLRVLELKDYVIAQELVEFLTCHEETLESFVMEDCHAIGYMTWADFFTLIGLCQFPRIKQFSVEYSRDFRSANLPEPEELELVTWEDLNASDNPLFVSVLAIEPTQRAFSYVKRDTLAGIVCNEERILTSFLEGRDWTAYLSLMFSLFGQLKPMVSR